MKICKSTKFSYKRRGRGQREIVLGKVEVKLKPNDCLERNRREMLIDGPRLRLRSQKIHPFEHKKKDFSSSVHSLHSVWKVVRNMVGPGQAVAGVWC